ncbi:hypothetical protein V6N13_109322 [Hibiscus sabdariffa]
MVRRLRALYYFDKSMCEHTQDDIPHDYEEEVHDPRVCGRFRYCHALLDRRNNTDFTELCNMFRDKLFEESIRFAPWEHEVHGEFKVNRGSEIFNLIDSTCRAEFNKDIDKYLIIVKFGVFRVHDDSYHDDFNDDNVETGFVPASKSSRSVGGGFGFGTRVCPSSMRNKEDNKKLSIAILSKMQSGSGSWYASYGLCTISTNPCVNIRKMTSHTTTRKKFTR